MSSEQNAPQEANEMKHLVKALLRKTGWEVHRLNPSAGVFSTSQPHVKKLSLDSRELQFWITDQTARVWYENPVESVHIPELQSYSKLLPKSGRVLEIGSNQGFFTCLSGLILGSDGFVLGVEPHPRNVLVAQANLALNGLGANCRVLQAAASNKAGEVIQISDCMNAAVETGLADHTISVNTITGDMLDEEHGPFDLLKVDVEGFECSVLAGCKNILSRKPRLAVEVHLDLMARYGGSTDQLWDLLGIANYAGVMVLRTPNPQTLVFDLAKLPTHGIVNLLLQPR